MNFQTVLFDFDGTLANTLPLCFESLRRVFAEYDGNMLTNADIVDLFGPTEEEIIRLHLQQKESAERAVADFYALYEGLHRSLVEPHQDIHSLLHELKGHGVKLGIVTGKGRKSLDISLRQLGLADLFDVTITGDDVKKPKPDPEGVLSALSQLNAGKDTAVFVGDSNADIHAGKSAGLPVIGVRWLEVVQSPVFEVEPDWVVSDVEGFSRVVGLISESAGEDKSSC